MCLLTGSFEIMITSWHGNASTVLAICEGKINFTYDWPIMQRFHFSFAVSLDELFNKRAKYRWPLYYKELCNISV